MGSECGDKLFLSFQASNDSTATQNALERRIVLRKIDFQITFFLLGSSQFVKSNSKQQSKGEGREMRRDYYELLMINQLCERLGLYQQIICCSEKLCSVKSASSWDLIKDAFTLRQRNKENTIKGFLVAHEFRCFSRFCSFWSQSFRWYFIVKCPLASAVCFLNTSATSVEGKRGA